MWPFTKPTKRHTPLITPLHPELDDEPAYKPIAQRSASTLRLSDWRKEKELTAIANRVLSDPDVMLMLDILANENPSYMLLPLSATPDARAALQARAEGYQMALTNLRALAKPLIEVAAPEATYEPVETQT